MNFVPKMNRRSFVVGTAAAGAGLTVSRVLSVEEAGVQPIPRAAPMQRSAMLAESAPPVPISAGEIEISAQVEMMVLAR